MQYSYSIDGARNIVHAVISGNVAVNEQIDMIRKIAADPAFRKGMGSITDIAEAVYDWHIQDIDKFRAFVHLFGNTTGDCKWALVFPSGITAAVTKIFIALQNASPERIKIKTFATEQEATQWLEAAYF